MKTIMKKKLGGWHRIWVLLSVIYFLVVVGYAFYLFPGLKVKGRRDIEQKWALEIIKLASPRIKELCITDAMTLLEQYLTEHDSNKKRHLESRHRIKIEASPNRKKIKGEWKDCHIIIIGAPPPLLYSTPLKELTFLEDANPKIVVPEVEKFYRQLEICDAQHIRSTLAWGETDANIISNFHKEYRNIYDFSAIDAKYFAEYKRWLINFIFKFVLTAFAFWIIPVISVYIMVFIMFVSIRWVVKGFREK